LSESSAVLLQPKPNQVHGGPTIPSHLSAGAEPPCRTQRSPQPCLLSLLPMFWVRVISTARVPAPTPEAAISFRRLISSFSASPPRAAPDATCAGIQTIHSHRSRPLLDSTAALHTHLAMQTISIHDPTRSDPMQQRAGTRWDRGSHPVRRPVEAGSPTKAVAHPPSCTFTVLDIGAT
jgi:hypothetical protein